MTNEQLEAALQLEREDRAQTELGLNNWIMIWRGRAEAAEKAKEEAERGRYWLIYFEDASRRPEVFSDESAARLRWKECLINWNCHLFAQVTQQSDHNALDAAREGK